MSDSLQPHGLQHARLPYPSLSPGACADSIKSVMLSNHLMLCWSLLLLPSVFPNIRSFPMSWLIWWPNYWIFSFSMSPSNSGLISFRIDWFDLLAVQGTLSRVFSSTIVQKHQFFGAQSSLWSNSHIYTWLPEKPFLWLYLLLLPLFSDFLS